MWCIKCSSDKENRKEYWLQYWFWRLIQSRNKTMPRGTATIAYYFISLLFNSFKEHEHTSTMYIASAYFDGIFSYFPFSFPGLSVARALTHTWCARIRSICKAHKMSNGKYRFEERIQSNEMAKREWITKHRDDGEVKACWCECDAIVCAEEIQSKSDNDVTAARAHSGQRLSSTHRSLKCEFLVCPMSCKREGKIPIAQCCRLCEFFCWFVIHGKSNLCEDAMNEPTNTFEMESSSRSFQFQRLKLWRGETYFCALHFQHISEFKSKLFLFHPHIPARIPMHCSSHSYCVNRDAFEVLDTFGRKEIPLKVWHRIKCRRHCSGWLWWAPMYKAFRISHEYFFGISNTSSSRRIEFFEKQRDLNSKKACHFKWEKLFRLQTTKCDEQI